MIYIRDAYSYDTEIICSVYLALYMQCMHRRMSLEVYDPRVLDTDRIDRSVPLQPPYTTYYNVCSSARWANQSWIDTNPKKDYNFDDSELLFGNSYDKKKLALEWFR